MSSEDPRLVRLSTICLAFPEATRELKHEHAAFVVRKKTFAYFLNNHHGDGIVSVTCKALPGDNQALATSDPTRFYLPAYLAPKGWIALRLDLAAAIDWDEVSELITGSYLQVAPKRLAALVRI